MTRMTREERAAARRKLQAELLEKLHFDLRYPAEEVMLRVEIARLDEIDSLEEALAKT